MDPPRPSSAARRSTLNIPPKPGAGLAEWTNKIKELQKQVDEDEEAETRRLEAEIAASRQARLRRSTGYGSRANSVDLSPSATPSPIRTDERLHSSEGVLSAIDRQRNQDDALRKLTGGNSSFKPSAQPTAATSTQVRKPAEPISLAAFIGGRATGPKLTKQAPQPDAHDPTLFEQRTQISAPHPVFGRGGVAMPGMTGHGSASVVSRAIREQENQLVASSNGHRERDRRISTPSTVRSVVEKVEERTVVPSSSGSSSPAPVRQRTISTPAGIIPARASPTVESFVPKPKVDSDARPLSHSPSPSARPITPHRDGVSSAVYGNSRSPAPRPTSAASNFSHTPPPPSPTRSPKPVSAVPGLARPIQPTPRPSFGSPQIPPSQNPSPAFLKPPPPKEPTPSLSRLQGRGFVQNMVKKTAELAAASPESSPTPDRRDSSGKRQSSVLERWQFNNTTGSPTPPPVISPKPMPLRKSLTADSGSPTSTSYNASLKSEDIGRILKGKSSLPSLPSMKTGDSAAGPSSVSESGYAGPRPKLGSSKTTVTYLQPAAQPAQDEIITPDVDELGMRTRTTSGGLMQGRGAAGLPTASGKPLSHPTKDRAKKPRKGKNTLAASPTNLAAIREASPTRDEPTLQREDKQGPHTAVQTASPDPSMPAQPSFNGTAKPKPMTPMLPPKPSVNVQASPATAPGKTSPVSPLAPPQPAQSPFLTPPQTSAQKVPSSPVKHTRIPSTGNRATVMDVAQVFQEVLQSTTPPSTSPVEAERPSPPLIAKDDEEDAYEPPNVKNMVANWGPRNNGAPTALIAPPLERRKSSYEKYASFVLPPLAEEKTPASSPAGTLARGAVPVVDIVKKDDTPTDADSEAKEKEKQLAEEVVVTTHAVGSKQEPRIEVVHLVHTDEPLPHVDVDAVYRALRPSYTPDPDLTMVSLDVLTIVGNTASAISKDANVFYDAELLAIVHRGKARSDGLVQTKVWGWQGRRAQVGEREAQKLQELARRYGTSLVMVQQAREPAELMSVLGGQLATRQGTRSHWSPENTAMHVVRSLGGSIYIDELDLGIKNLCSGFSYCISILDTYYVWYGRGSTAAERQAAVKYAQGLASSAENVVELTEDESLKDEMFWMILGEGDYAKADYWQWRAQAPAVDPRAWGIDSGHGGDAIRPIAFLPTQQEFAKSVYLVDCIWELFVLVGSEARGRRLEIRLGLLLAEELSRKASAERPFKPTVHVLIFPTQIPTDLLLTFRELEESELNGGSIPDHMNLIPAGDAVTDLNATSWTLTALKDHSMLPLGVMPSDLS
ncbi:hypothetical protein BD414DRAFT_513494 [Trametes punicea]|nr:hypothetical protein BD414DRAFT_513494 [Trametes punicea]